MNNPPADPALKPGEIVLHLRPLPCAVPVVIRLRQLLKTALRRDRLRCVRIAGDGLDDPAATHQLAPDAPGSARTARPSSSTPEAP